MRVCYLFVFLSAILFCSCSKKGEHEKQLTSHFDHEQFFLLDPLSRSLSPEDDIGSIAELNEIPDSLLKKWVNPLSHPGQSNKMVSYQFSKNDFHVIVIMIIGEQTYDKKTDSTKIYQSEQYLLTIRDDDSIIDALKIQEGFSKDRLDNTIIDGKEIMAKNRAAVMKGDSITLYDTTWYNKTTVISEREDYIETAYGRQLGVLETVLDEEFKGGDASFFVIGPDGKINQIKFKKGELVKVGETSGERIKI